MSDYTAIREDQGDGTFSYYVFSGDKCVASKSSRVSDYAFVSFDGRSTRYSRKAIADGIAIVDGHIRNYFPKGRS